MRPVHIIAVGGLGASIARSMATYGPTAMTYPDAKGHVVPAEWPLSSVHVLASWRPTPRLTSLLDAAAFSWRVPWLPIICEHPYLRLGPAVVPGRSGCYGCFRRRLLQHSQRADLDEALHREYDVNHHSGPAGFLNAFAEFVAAAAWEIIQQMLVAPDAQAGQVRQLDMITLQTTLGHAVGVHGCPRCGLQRPERTRSFDQLCADMNHWWPATALGRAAAND